MNEARCIAVQYSSMIKASEAPLFSSWFAGRATKILCEDREIVVAVILFAGRSSKSKVGKKREEEQAFRPNQSIKFSTLQQHGFENLLKTNL